MGIGVAAMSCPESVLAGNVYAPREAESGALCVGVAESEREKEVGYGEESLCGGYGRRDDVGQTQRRVGSEWRREKKKQWEESEHPT